MKKLQVNHYIILLAIIVAIVTVVVSRLRHQQPDPAHCQYAGLHDYHFSE